MELKAPSQPNGEADIDSTVNTYMGAKHLLFASVTAFPDFVHLVVGKEKNSD